VNFITYKCNTCKREIDIEEDQLRVFINKCSITQGCAGKLVPIKTKKTRNILSTDLDTTIFNKNNTLYPDKNNSDINFVNLNSSYNTITIAIREFDDVPLPPRINLRFNINSQNSTTFDEFVYRVSNTKIISGKDNSNIQKVLKFSNTDNVLVFLNGQVLDESSYEKSYFNSIGTSIILTNMIYSLSTIKILVYKPSDIVYTNYLEFFENKYVTSFNTAWNNVNYVKSDGKNYKLFSSNQILNLPINSRLNLYPGDNDALIDDNECFILIANPHYTVVDRILSSRVPLNNFVNDENYLRLSLQNKNYMIQCTNGCVMTSSLMQPVLMTPDTISNVSSVDNSYVTNDNIISNIIGII
jgi:hypothetical protein